MSKTNAIRLLDKYKVKYQLFENIADGPLDAVSVANRLNEDPNNVYKTLVTISNNRINYVFIVQANMELDLKKCARAVNEKSIEMIPQKNLLPLTGYIHGGCSPFGMKKQFKTILDESAMHKDYIYVSAGKIGMQVKINPNDLIQILNGEYKDVAVF